MVRKLHSREAVKHMVTYFLRLPSLFPTSSVIWIFSFPLFALCGSSLLPCPTSFDHHGLLSGIWVLGEQFPKFRPSSLAVGPSRSRYCRRQRPSSFMCYSHRARVGFPVGTCWWLWSLLFSGPFFATLLPSLSFLTDTEAVHILWVYQTICILEFKRILSHLIWLWCCVWVWGLISVVVFLCGDLGRFKMMLPLLLPSFLEFSSLIFQRKRFGKNWSGRNRG